MKDSKPNQTPKPSAVTGQISYVILPQENGRFACALSPSPTDTDGNDIVFYGQTWEHTLAIALEHVADQYRTAAEAGQQQRQPDDAQEKRLKRYHVILHYERVIEEESRFEAMHETLLGNTVVENAKCTLIEISPDVQQQVVGRNRDFDD